MPRVDSLSEEIIDRIAQEVQELLPEIVSDFGSLQLGSVEAELEETLSVWMLGGILCLKTLHSQIWRHEFLTGTTK